MQTAVSTLDIFLPSLHLQGSMGKATTSIRKSATQTFQLMEPVWDLRDAIPSLLLIALISPLGFFVASYTACLALFVAYWGLPPLIGLQWPTFGSPNIFDDLRLNAGASLSFVASMTAAILQVIALKF
jgi:hypothetical protein